MNSKFASYVLKRFLMAILTIFLVIAITFFVMHAIPASPFSSEKAKSDATIAALEAKYGFDKPLPVQFFNYIKGILHGDFGLSTKWVGSTVIDLIMGGFSYSARLGLGAASLAIVLGVILSAVGLYGPLADFAGAGATVPLTGFGHALVTGVKRAVDEIGFMGAFSGGLTSTAAGIAAAVFFGTMMALLFKPRGKE